MKAGSFVKPRWSEKRNRTCRQAIGERRTGDHSLPTRSSRSALVRSTVPSPGLVVSVASSPLPRPAASTALVGPADAARFGGNEDEKEEEDEGPPEAV